MTKQDNIIKGMVATTLAFMMFSIMNMLAKILSENYNVIEISFYRNFIATLPFLFMIFVMKKKEIMKINSRPKAVITRAVIGTLSLVITFAAFAVMPMADTTAFLFTASLIIPILGFFCLGEKVGIYRWSAVLVGFIGVLIMLSPSGNINALGVILALSAALLHAILQIILRYLGKTEKPETIAFYFVAIGTIITVIPLPWVAHIPTWQEVPLLLGVGLTGFAAQYLISVAFGNAPVAVVTVFNYSAIIWATIFGWLIWTDWPAQTIWIGGTIVITSNIFIIWRESCKGQVTGTRVNAKF